MALAAGGTNYNNLPLSEMKKDIEKWIRYIEEDKSKLLDGRRSLILNKEWDKIGYDYTAAVEDTLNRCDTLKEILTNALSEMTGSTVTEHAISLLQQVGEMTESWYEELNHYAASVISCANSNKQSVSEIQELLYTGANLMSDMWDANNMVEPMRKRYLFVNGLVTPEPQKTKVLLVVATKVELDALKDELEHYCVIGEEISDPVSGFHASIDQKQLFIVKSQMGSEGAGGSILTIAKAINEFKPECVIMCGIAWGGNKKKQKIGDLIVSQKVWAYEPGKIAADGSFTPRGSINEASPKLVSMFEVSSSSETEFNIHYGLTASGGKLLDSKDAVKMLKSLQPELIGGDMESAGMAYVCVSERVDWIMVKGICDWGFYKQDNKDEHQAQAAKNAAKTVVEMLVKWK